jgi:hypothetical protein
MARALLTDDTSIGKYEIEPTTPIQPGQEWTEYFHYMPARQKSLWLINTLLFSLQCIKQESNLDVDVKGQDAFIICARNFEELFTEIQKGVLLDDSSRRHEWRVKAMPELDSVEFELNPIIDVPPRTGKRYPLRIQAQMKAEYEPGPVEIE